MEVKNGTLAEVETALAEREQMTEGTLQQFFGPVGDPYERTNLNPADETESLLYLAAVGGETLKLSQLKESELNIVFFHAKTAEFVNRKTAEVTNGIRCVFIDDQGVVYSTTSVSAIRTIAAKARMGGGLQRWDPPLKVKKEMHGEVGGQYITLSPIIDAAMLKAAVSGKRKAPK